MLDLHTEGCSFSNVEAVRTGYLTDDFITALNTATIAIMVSRFQLATFTIGIGWISQHLLLYRNGRWCDWDIDTVVVNWSYEN
ncbi:hypothetical protein ST201phi2-1p015 [Pseudomonas phage 201phi2-1]|uniref:Uncharacterized protein n=1 Tax=Pseudomonas phage 201phi2-1 TaxID=198110 RepID=B3FJZ1_BP201|nr:hypothetical protein ST201phi2-1p015 [Pseudomonas phage 201phi2-1]ABY62849.1 hypothetical protein 201phi2-1p015 [Pseudomonas phage 201phi2-1]